MSKNRKLILIYSIVSVIIIITLAFLLFTNKNKKYEIIFETNGGTKIEKQIVEEGKRATRPENPKKGGYYFKDWMLEDKIYNFNTKVTKDMTLYATWEIIVERYEVKFNSDGGSNIVTQTIEKNSQALIPQNPTKNGYTFKGWYLNDKKFDFKSLITENIELIAKWEKIKSINSNKKNYTIKFDSNGGTPISEMTVIEGQKISKPENPTKSGYTFVGWTLNEKEYNFANKVTSNITLTANWEISINYSLNCYTKESVDANNWQTVSAVSKGDQIVCTTDFETHSIHKIKEYQYELSFGNSLKLIGVNSIDEAKVNGKAYSFNLKKPTSVGELLGMFTFEVKDTQNENNLFVALENVKFKTTKEETFTDSGKKKILKSIWNYNSYVPYKMNSFRMECYNEKDLLMNNFSAISNVKLGDRIVCTPGYETYATDKIEYLKYEIDYGRSLRLVSIRDIAEAEANGRLYTFRLKNPTSIADAGTLGTYVFEVINTSDINSLYIGIRNIKFITTDKNYYYNIDYRQHYTVQ